MPPRSASQARAMFAAASGNSTLGIPKKVGTEFTSDLKKGSVSKLPERVTPKAKGKSSNPSAGMPPGGHDPSASMKARRLAGQGLISEKQLAKMSNRGNSTIEAKPPKPKQGIVTPEAEENSKVQGGAGAPGGYAPRV